MYGSASASTRAFSAACGLCTKGAFIGAPILQTKEKGEPPSGARLLRYCSPRLLDRDLLALGRRFLRQRELQHAVAELGFRLALVDLLRQRKAAADLAVDALTVQHSLVLGDFLLALDLGLERDLRAVDGDVDVFLLHARQLGAHDVGAVLLRHVDLG